MRRLPGGLLALALLAAACTHASPAADMQGAAAGPGKERAFYIAADVVAWDYAPAGRNDVAGAGFTGHDAIYVDGGPDRIGKVYKKSLYREYTDGTFTTLKARPAAWEHLGMLGPVIHAEVGDTIKVVFKNNTPFPASMHPHGVFYDKASEGAPYTDGTSGPAKADDAVAPGQSFTYNWQVPERAGPGPMDPSSVMWMYHSHVDEVADTYAGLMGPIVVTRKGMARPDGSPKDVDRELVAMFMVMNENNSPWLEENIRTYASRPASVNTDDPGFQEANLKHAVNGEFFGNLPGLDVVQGQRVRWYLMGMGTEVDLHTPHWHGNVVTVNGMRTDVVSLMPATMVVADMRPDDPGTWLLHCHVGDHITAGMQALYQVHPAVP
jgi:FtsP/CotA-like multicopper oxidase with cupredoxin domain